MNNHIGHIIGLDEIHKKKLIRTLPNHIKIIDLDEIQQKIYNQSDILKQKSVWSQISKEIIMLRKRKKLIGSKRIKTSSLNKQIKKLLSKRNQIRQNIMHLWKTKMTHRLDLDLKNKGPSHVLFLGFNIFPKDYRVKINLPLNQLPQIANHKKYFNKIMVDAKPANYAANQIKYYLSTYSNKIIKGTFPLNLLKLDYLSNRYDKFINFYDKQGYQLLPQDELLDFVKELDKQVSARSNLANKYVYVATLFRSNDLIPVNAKTPIEGYLTKEEAISSIKARMKNNAPVYLYQIKADQFHLINGKLIANQALYPVGEESLLPSVS